MGWKSTADWEAWCARRSQRIARRGLVLEGEVEQILQAMQAAGTIQSFTHHQKFSSADCDGKDFTVRKEINGTIVDRSFGVTIAQKSKNRAEFLHDGTPQFWLPIGTKPETIRRKIEALFLA